MDSRLLVTTSVLALCLAAQVHAEGAAAGSAPAAAVASSSQPDSAAALATSAAGAPSATSVGEVVVTAERRSRSVQTTPISVTVLAGADLQKQGITSVDQLQFAMPSLTLQNFGQGNSFDIRGIGKGDSSSTVGVGVITYRDGVATFPGYFQDEPYYDLASIEVLRGPQGTFIGQNATGGAVFITEANPSFDGYHGFIQGQYGNYNDAQVRGAINLPISDTLAARVAFNDEYHDSFYHITGPYSGDPGRLRESNVRGSLLWQPTTNFRALFKVDYNYVDRGGDPADPATATNDPFHITSNAHWLAIDQFVRTVADLSYTLDDGIKIRSVSGYQQGRTSTKLDLDGTSALPLTFQDGVGEKIFSQELNVISPDKGFLTWIAGMYYQHDSDHYPTNTGYNIGEPSGVYNFTFNGANPRETLAEFGQVSFNLPYGLQIQGGLRNTYSRDTNRAQFGIPEYGIFLYQDQTERDSKVTGKVALNWTINRNNFLYAFIATGHKGGGLNSPSGVALPTEFKPEDVRDYEVGWKATTLGGHLRTQIGGYYNDYDNFQVSISDPNSPANSLLLNVPSTTKIYGIETQAEATFGGLAMNFGASYLNSQLGNFYASDPRLPATQASCQISTGPAGGSCVNLSGVDQVYAPHVTFNASARYAFELPQGTLTPRLDFGHIGPQWATLFEDRALGDRLETRNLLNANIDYVYGTWTVSAYGTNLNNQHYISGILSGLRYAGAPRQYGVRLAKSF